MTISASDCYSRCTSCDESVFDEYLTRIGDGFYCDLCREDDPTLVDFERGCDFCGHVECGNDCCSKCSSPDCPWNQNCPSCVREFARCREIETLKCLAVGTYTREMLREAQTTRVIELRRCAWCSKRIRSGEDIMELRSGDELRVIHPACRAEVLEVLHTPTVAV